MTTRRITGFTLIEVLVVVAIIALLTAILLPSLSRARAQAKVTSCVATLQQIGRATLSYTTVSREYYPLTAKQGDDNWYALWKARFVPTLKMLICPATQNVIRPETLKWNIKYKTGPDKEEIPYFRDPADTQDGDLCKTAKNRQDARGGHSYEYSGCYGGAANDKYRPMAGRHRKTGYFQAYASEIAFAWDVDREQGSGPEWKVGCQPSLGDGNDCPQPWDTHGAAGQSYVFGDGHAAFLKKVSGTWVDMTAGSPTENIKFGSGGSPKISVNFVIDRVQSRAWEPWYYYRE